MMARTFYRLSKSMIRTLINGKMEFRSRLKDRVILRQCLINTITLALVTMTEIAK